MAFALGLTWLGLGADLELGWLPAAVAAGALLHVLCDLLTGDGVPLLWPLRRRFSVPVLGRTGSPAEGVLGVALVVYLAWLAAATFTVG